MMTSHNVSQVMLQDFAVYGMESTLKSLILAALNFDGQSYEIILAPLI